MNIYGEKVLLRAIEPHDNSMLLDLINDPDTEQMLGGSSFPVSAEAQSKWISDQIGRSDVLRCIVADQETPDNGLGTIILSDIDLRNGVAQVHLKLLPSSRGKGYGSDSLKAIVNYSFKQMRLHCLYAYVLEYNRASQKTFERCGFRKEGILRARAYKNGSYVDCVSYSIISDDD